MKRIIPVVFACVVCYVAGLVTHLSMTAVSAQEGKQMAPAPPKAMDGKAMYYSKEDIEKMFPPADKTGEVPPLTVSTHLGWDPFYRFTEMRRPAFDPPRKSAASGQMINYPDAEMHENKTQIYMPWRGTATVDVGGKPESERPGPYSDGQHGGASRLLGATSYKMKPGDILIIPPNTWHHVKTDPGQTFSYHMCHVETRRLIP